jgi:hypothetical protein
MQQLLEYLLQTRGFDMMEQKLPRRPRSDAGNDARSMVLSFLRTIQSGKMAKQRSREPVSALDTEMARDDLTHLRVEAWMVGPRRRV